MPNIKITVAGKIATNTTPDAVIVCGNSDYTVTFDLDAEWAAETDRTARFSYIRDGRTRYKEKPFQGNTVAVPKLAGVRQVTVGLYAGDLHTTTAAAIWCKPSILCGDAVEEITQEEKAGLVAQMGDLAKLETTDKSSLVAAVNEVRRTAAAGGGSGENSDGNSSDSSQDTTVDLTGYAKEQWVQEGFQPKGNYLTEVPEGYAKTEDIPKAYALPVGGDVLGGVKNGGNVVINADGTMTAPESEVQGMTSDQIAALHGMFKVCAFNRADVSAEYAAFIAAFGIEESEEEEPHTHAYTSAVTTAATCTTAGVRTYTCECGESYTESIPATGHTYADGVCSVCGAADPNYNPAVTLSSISATYSGGDVAVGTAVTDLAGVVVTAHYSDGSTENVTEYTLSGTIAEGSNTVTVSYGGKTTTFTVTGVAESGGGDETTGEFGLVIPQGHAGAVTLDITPADADSMEITLALPKVKTGAIVCNGEKWIGIYTDYPNNVWGNAPSIAYADIAGQGKTTISYDSISMLNQTAKPIELTYAPNKIYTLGYTLYEMVFYKEGVAVCSLKPTTTLGNLYDSVSGKTYTFTVTDGLSFA